MRTCAVVAPFLTSMTFPFSTLRALSFMGSSPLSSSIPPRGRGGYATPVARLTIRIDLSARRAIGPGKIKLLELIGQSGSISAAGRAMNMSYRRAWTLIDNLNRSFRTPVVETQLGGTRGGGAALSPLGREVIAWYRAIEQAATNVSAKQLAALDAVQPLSRAATKGGRRPDKGSDRSRSSLMPRRARV